MRVRASFVRDFLKRMCLDEPPPTRGTAPLCSLYCWCGGREAAHLQTRSKEKREGEVGKVRSRYRCVWGRATATPRKTLWHGKRRQDWEQEKASDMSGHASVLFENDCGRKKQLKHLYGGKTGSRAHACGPVAEERRKAERKSRHAMQSRPPCCFVSPGFTQLTCPLFILMRAAGPLHARFSSFSFHRNTQGT